MLESWIFRFLYFWFFGFSDFWIFGILEFQIFDMCGDFCCFACCLFVVLGFWYTWVPKIRFSMHRES